MLILLCFDKVKSQTASAAVSNHVFQMCDSGGEAITSYNQSFYMSFYKNGIVLMLCGSNLGNAINNGAKKSGTWKSSGNRVWFVWSDGKRSEDWILDEYTGNFVCSSSILKNLGKF